MKSGGEQSAAREIAAALFFGMLACLKKQCGFGTDLRWVLQVGA